MSEPERPKPFLEKALEMSTATGVIGIIIGVAAKVHSLLIPSIELAAGSFIGKKVAFSK